MILLLGAPKTSFGKNPRQNDENGEMGELVQVITEGNACPELKRHLIKLATPRAKLYYLYTQVG